MSKMIRYREPVNRTEHNIFFPHEPGRMTAGYSFPCDADGKVNVEALNPCAQKNYAMCQRERASLAVVQAHNYTFFEPALMECECGHQIEIPDHHDVRCERCRREYNSAGTLLAHRSQWGEETGETAADYYQGIAEGDY